MKDLRFKNKLYRVVGHEASSLLFQNITKCAQHLQGFFKFEGEYYGLRSSFPIFEHHRNDLCCKNFNKR